MNAVEKMLKIYGRIDARVAEVLRLHAKRLKCRRACRECCVDAITVFEVEADIIRHYYQSLLETGAPHPEGGCAFLDEEGSCRIYEHRPYVCRTQGLPLRWIEEEEGEGGELEIREYRDICPLNEKGEPIELLDADACWTLGWAEGELAALQKEKDGGVMRRVGLRDLFRKTSV